MREAGFNRGFDVYVEGLKIVDDFNPGIVQGGVGSIDHAAVVTHEFVAPDATLNVTLIRPAAFPTSRYRSSQTARLLTIERSEGVV